MQTLTELIEEKIAIAHAYRGLDSINPVEIVIEDEFRNKYSILVSRFEPDAVTVPFNVCWINNDPAHKDYKTMQRRVDAENYDEGGYRYSWSVISEVAEIFTELQYYKKAADPILGEVEDFGLLPATKVDLGAFRLTAETQAPEDVTSISDTDPRMSDSRDPKDHNHGEQVTTMLAAGIIESEDVHGDPVFSQAISYVSANAPTKGDVFSITGVSLDGLSFTGEWKKPNTIIAYEGPRPVLLHVLGPVEIVDGLTNHVLRANVEMDDGSTFVSVQAKWEVIANGVWGKVGANTGVFQALEVQQQQIVRVKATWVHPESGDTITNFIDITIRDTSGVVRLTGLQILGPGQLLKTDAATTYTVQAEFSNGETSLVNPNSFTSSNPQAGNFVSGVLTPSVSQMGNKTTTLTATYIQGGISKTSTLVVLVKDTVVYPDVVTIVGVASLNQNTFSDYTISVHYTDGSTATKTAKSWSMEDSTYATVSVSGRLTAKALVVKGDKQVVIKTTYSENGVDLAAQKQVTVKDNIVYPVSAKITGPLSVLAGQTGQYKLMVKYTDNTEVERTPSLWASANTTNATITNTGLMTAKNISSAATVQLSATYSEQGVNLNPTLNVQVTVPAPQGIRWGVAKFANKNFTGGIIEPLTQQQIEYGVTNANTPQGLQYDHWANVQAFFDAVMTNSLPPAGGLLDTMVGVDEYAYVAYPSNISSLSYLDLISNFPETLTGVQWPDDVVGEPSPPTPDTVTVNVSVGGVVGQWKIQRMDFAGPMARKWQITANT